MAVVRLARKNEHSGGETHFFLGLTPQRALVQGDTIMSEGLKNLRDMQRHTHLIAFQRQPRRQARELATKAEQQDYLSCALSPSRVERVSGGGVTDSGAERRDGRWCSGTRRLGGRFRYNFLDFLLHNTLPHHRRTGRCSGGLGGQAALTSKAVVCREIGADGREGLTNYGGHCCFVMLPSLRMRGAMFLLV